LFITFPFPIILALLLNELRMNRYKRTLQTIFTFPNFLSWVVVTGITINVLSFDGLVNSLIRVFGGTPVSFIGNESLFIPLVFATEVWKSAGWGSIIYLAAMAGIDPGLYEASDIDGATRIQKIIYITLPSILPTVTVMFILATGNIMKKGFEQVFNLSNPAVRNVSEILDVYIYNITFRAVPNFGYSTALSLFRSVVNLFFLVIANAGSKWLTGSGLFGMEENQNE
jgi:putative aldouronate transport system permease protein